jgi:predicted dehydrogenase
MNKIRLGMIGGGKNSFIGFTHRLAAKMDNEFELVGGIFSADYKKSIDFAKELNLDTNRVYRSVDQLIDKELSYSQDERIQAVTIATPNYMHFEAAKKLIMSRFHIICDKPVTMTLNEAEHLEDLVKQHEVVFCLTHNYTGYPMIREFRNLIESDAIGRIQKIDVQFYIGAFNQYVHEEEKRKGIWRLDPEKAGISCNIGDLGTHAFNLLEYVTKLEVREVLADLNTLYDDIVLDLDATVLLRFAKNLKGVLRSSHIATGEEMNLKIMVYGSKGGLTWEQENPTYLYLLHDNEPTQVFTRARSYNSPFSLYSSRVFYGLPEGFFGSFANLYRGAAKAIRKQAMEEVEFPTISDGVRTMKFVEAVVKSHNQGNVWISL